MENIWLISIAALVVGAIIGYLMGRSGGGINQAELAAQLEETKQELENYKSEVTTHFEKTAALVNNLTDSYKEVHEHLATGAQGLCQPGAIDLALEPSMQPKLSDSSEEPEQQSEETQESVEPPLDYAPKSPDEEGTLSETFGLKEKEEEEQENSPAPSDATPQKEEKEEKAPA